MPAGAAGLHIWSRGALPGPLSIGTASQASHRVAPQHRADASTRAASMHFKHGEWAVEDNLAAGRCCSRDLLHTSAEMAWSLGKTHLVSLPGVTWGFAQWPRLEMELLQGGADGSISCKPGPRLFPLLWEPLSPRKDAAPQPLVLGYCQHIQCYTAHFKLHLRQQSMWFGNHNCVDHIGL